MSIEVVNGLREPADDLTSYRPLSALAVASAVIGLLSVVVLLSWTLSIIPLLGMATGLVAMLRIRANPAELTGQRIAALGMALSFIFLAASWSWAALVYFTEVPDGYDRISWSQLQLDETAPLPIVPEEARQLDGQRVFIKGYMYPGSQQSGIEEFVLVRDNGDCCFGGNKPPLSDMILVRLPAEHALDYSTQPRRLAGVLRVEPAEAAEGLAIVYQLEAEYAR